MTSTEHVIRCERVTKRFGDVVALDALDLAVARGSVTGYLGPNGAGKSTTIRILLDLARADAGSVTVLGADPRTAGQDQRRRIGYLPGERLVGLSKLARVVDHFARNLQVQERLTAQVAGWFDRELAPKGVGVVLEAAALILGGFGPGGVSSDFNPLLTSAGLASWIALGMVGATALIAVMIRLTLRGARSSAVQAATGFFYLAVITAMTAEFAAKVRFLP